MNGVRTRKQAVQGTKANGSANGYLSPPKSTAERSEVTENIFLFIPNIIGIAKLLAFSALNHYLQRYQVIPESFLQ